MMGWMQCGADAERTRNSAKPNRNTVEERQTLPPLLAQQSVNSLSHYPMDIAVWPVATDDDEY